MIRISALCYFQSFDADSWITGRHPAQMNPGSIIFPKQVKDKNRKNGKLVDRLNRLG